MECVLLCTFVPLFITLISYTLLVMVDAICLKDIIHEMSVDGPYVENMGQHSYYM